MPRVTKLQYLTVNFQYSIVNTKTVQSFSMAPVLYFYSLKQIVVPLQILCASYICQIPF